MVKFDKLEEESLEEFVLRLSDLKVKDKSITWQGISDNVYLNYGINRSEAWVRRIVKKSLNLVQEEDLLNDLDEVRSQIEAKTLELKKERAKLSDERIQNNAYIRRLSREETIKEIAFNIASQIKDKKFLPSYNNVVKVKNDAEEKEAILCISDWHYGLDFKNPWNEFNPEICKERVSKLRDKVIKYIKLHKCNILHLVNLQDLIAGRIHLGLRLESRFDVITQTIEISEILAEFISSLTKYVEVKYYDCLDNHSRLEPNKNDAQDLETLARIIPWYLKERLKSNDKVAICENEFGHDLITFETLGHKVIGVHGDKDKPLTVIDHLSMMTEQHYDLVLTAHMHHFSADEKNRTVAISNGTLMGTDGYAQKLRLSSNPSQNLIIVSRENVTESVHRILI